MSTLALNRRVLAWAGAPLLLLAACGDDAVTPQDDTTTATDSESGGSTMGTTDGVDTSSSGNEPTSNGSETEPTTTQTPPTTDPDTSSSEGSSGPLPAVCGNNVIEDEEVCDLAQVNGETCESLGYEGGQLGCMLTCDAYNLLGCFICGNEVIDLAEDCEGEVPEDVTCESLGFQDGFVTCGDDCLYDTSECSVCGDGIAAGFEACDGLDFNGETCQTLGFTGGTLACNLAECTFVVSGCDGGLFVEDFEDGDAIPEDFAVEAGAPWTVDAALPINGTRSARSGSLPNGGTTDLTLQATFPDPGTISFIHREDTASGWDYLRFYRNGALQQSWTGNNQATEYSAPVPAGAHTFEWRFERAGFVDAGQNAVWVDDITLEGGVPM